MASSMEYEKTYLCSEVPERFISGPGVRMIDVYLPELSDHPKLRLRQKGNRFEITKKTPVDGDPSRQIEDTIVLTEDEFRALGIASSRKIEKLRYPLKYEGFEAELDVFTGEHAGLILVDFEFDDPSVMESFEQPHFCAADVTTEDSIAGGVLSGLGKDDLFDHLASQYGYRPVGLTIDKPVS